MALTPLTIPRRNVVALDFGDPTIAVPDTGLINTMSYGPAQTQYPVVSASAGDVAPDNPGVALGTEPRFGFLLVKGETAFGCYYPSIVEPAWRADYTWNGFGLLTDDGTQFLITVDASSAITEGFDFPVALGYRYLPADQAEVVLLTEPGGYFPLDGQVPPPDDYGFTATAQFAPVYTIGTGVLAKDSLSNSLQVGDLDGVWLQAYELDAGFTSFNAGPITTNDGTDNFTLNICQPLSGTGNTLSLSRWQAVEETPVFTNYAITLSDEDDDAAFQAAADVDFANVFRARGNLTNAFITIDEAPDEATTALTVFYFADDFSWYDRLDVTSNGDLSFAAYFRDMDGLHYLVGTDAGGAQSYQTLELADGGEEPGDGTSDSSTLRVWQYALDGHDYYVLRLGTSATLVYDLSTDQWCEWASPDAENWRAHVGQNWVGMGADTIAREWGTDIVAGDDTHGVLYILDPEFGRDEDPVTGVAASFERVVTGGLPADGRETMRCGAVTLAASAGAPVDGDDTITLETSDDLGHSWLDHGSVTLSTGAFGQTVEWRALGLIRAPGRVFRLTDHGAVFRLSAMDMR